MLSSRGSGTIALGVRCTSSRGASARRSCSRSRSASSLAPTLAWMWVRLMRPADGAAPAHRPAELVEGGDRRGAARGASGRGPLPARARWSSGSPVLGEQDRGDAPARATCCAAATCCAPLPRGRYTLRGARGDHRRPVRPGRVADPAGARGHAAGVPARRTSWTACSPTPARPAVTRAARCCTGRPGYDLHSHPRLPGGREPAPRALAVDRQAPQADGQGDDRDAARRGRGAARRRRDGRSPARVGSSSFDAQVRAAASLLPRMVDAASAARW